VNQFHHSREKPNILLALFGQQVLKCFIKMIFFKGAGVTKIQINFGHLSVKIPRSEKKLG
jgi:hypothetical protein